MISLTLIRGDKLLKGSWKTTCISRRKGTICLGSKPSMFWLRYTIGPLEETSLNNAMPSVDLPEPDSPTTPSVSPSRIDRVTPSTALTAPTCRLSTPARMGKWTLRSVVSTTVLALAGRGLGSPLG